MKCNICSFRKFKEKYYIKDLKHKTSNKSFLVMECLNCGILVVTDKRKPVNGSIYYPDDYSAFKKISFKKKDDNTIFPRNVLQGRMAWTKLVTLTPETKVLDIGCGSGSNMLFIKEHFDSDLYGIEPNEIAVKEGAKQGLNIFKGTLDDYTGNEKFDIIYLLHVIEHLSNPKITLDKVFSLLKPNGKLVIGTPNTNSFERYFFAKYWDGWDTPRHIYMFNPKTINYLLKDIGYNNIQIHYEKYSIFSRSFKNMSGIKKTNRPPKIIRGINAIIDIFLRNALPFLKFSGAIQVIAHKNKKTGENEY